MWFIQYGAKRNKKTLTGKVGKRESRDSPKTVQVAEVDPLPETAAKAVTEPAGDGEHPQSDRQLGETQSLLVSAAESDRKRESTCKVHN